MIRRTLLSAIAALMIGSIPNSASAFVSHNLNPDTFGSAQISLGDGATGGCWTNLGEAKTYAEDNLRGLGYTVASVAQGVFLVSVNSQRMSNGKCYGDIGIQMWRSEIVNGLFGLLEVASSSQIFVGYDNANILVLDQIKSLIDEMAEEQRTQ